MQLFSGYYDLTTGAKDKKESFTKIAELVGLKAEEFLFLSDLTTGLYSLTAQNVHSSCKMLITYITPNVSFKY